MAKRHKYILKVGSGDSARYFYTQEEVNAYRKGQASNSIKDGANQVKGAIGKKAIATHRARAKVGIIQRGLHLKKDMTKGFSTVTVRDGALRDRRIKSMISDEGKYSKAAKKAKKRISKNASFKQNAAAIRDYGKNKALSLLNTIGDTHLLDNKLTKRYK